VEFKVEQWSSVLPELRPLFAFLWAEVALDKDKMRAVCNEEGYATMERLNMLHVVTARTDKGELAGYHVSFITPHLHYKEEGPMCFTDMYWTHPKMRVGGLGAKLLTFLVESLKERGIVKAYLSHKVSHDRSELFTALGWKPCDVVYCRYLGDK
jgi:GNAT superfamily N-acetyltransferase